MERLGGAVKKQVSRTARLVELMRVNLPLKSIGFGRYRSSPNIYLFFKRSLTFSKG